MKEIMKDTAPGKIEERAQNPQQNIPPRRLRRSRKGFLDDSIPNQAKFYLYAIGDFPKKQQFKAKVDQLSLKRSNSVGCVRKKEFFIEKQLLPKSMRLVTRSYLKELYLIYLSGTGSFRLFFEKLIHFYGKKDWNRDEFNRIMMILMTFTSDLLESIYKIFNNFTELEFCLYMIKTRPNAKPGDGLKAFILNEFILKSFPKTNNKNEAKQIQKQDQQKKEILANGKPKGRGSAFFNRGDGLKLKRKSKTFVEGLQLVKPNRFRFMRFNTFHVGRLRRKETKKVALVPRKLGHAHHKGCFCYAKKVELDNTKMFGQWTNIFFATKILVEKTQKKTDYIKNDKVLCRVCETEMSRSKFLSHIGLCYKKTKKLLKITSISEEILNRIKKFERTRMSMKLKIMAKHFKDKFQGKIELKGTEGKRATLFGALDFQDYIRKLDRDCDPSTGDNEDLDVVNQQRNDYKKLLHISKILKSFSHELKLDTLFTKQDLIVRRELQSAITSVTKSEMNRQVLEIMFKLGSFIDQRLAEIRKFIELSTEASTDCNMNVRSRRGASFYGSIKKTSIEISPFKSATKMTVKGRKKGAELKKMNSLAVPKIQGFKLEEPSDDDSFKYFGDSDQEIDVDALICDKKSKLSFLSNEENTSLTPIKSFIYGKNGDLQAHGFSPVKKRRRSKLRKVETEVFSNYTLTTSKTKTTTNLDFLMIPEAKMERDCLDDDNYCEASPSNQWSCSNHLMETEIGEAASHIKTTPGKTARKVSLGTKVAFPRINQNPQMDPNRIVINVNGVLAGGGSSREVNVEQKKARQEAERECFDEFAELDFNTRRSRRRGRGFVEDGKADCEDHFDCQDPFRKFSEGCEDQRPSIQFAKLLSEVNRTPRKKGVHIITKENFDQFENPKTRKLSQAKQLELNWPKILKKIGSSLLKDTPQIQRLTKKTQEMPLTRKKANIKFLALPKSAQKQPMLHSNKYITINRTRRGNSGVQEEENDKDDGNDLNNDKPCCGGHHKCLNDETESQQSNQNTNTTNYSHDDYLDNDIERLTASAPSTCYRANPSLFSELYALTAKDFHYVHTLGEGAYGKVYLVKKKMTGDYFAMKVIGSDSELSRRYVNNLLNEREVFSVIKSPFCVNALATFVYKNLVCFVMEYLPGRDLHEELFERETYWLDSFALKFYLAEIVLGVEDLHQNGIIHRDIKPANVLIDAEGHLKLTDFGLSEFRSKIGSTTKDGKTLIKGSANYLAPETIKGAKVGFEADWWALGVMAYLLVNREFPFDGESVREVMKKIQEGKIDWSNVGDGDWEMSYDLQDLVLGLLEPCPEKRLGHNGSEEIKKHKFFKEINWERARQMKLPLYEPEDILDVSQFEKKVGGEETADGGSQAVKEMAFESMDLFLNREFCKIVSRRDKQGAGKTKLPFCNSFKLLRNDTLHRTNLKIKKQIKAEILRLSQEEQQAANVVHDYCEREGLFFYNNFNLL